MRVQQFERSLDIFRPASQEYCFRDFQFQKMRGHLGSMQIAQQTFSKIVLAEFSSTRVQGDMSEVNTCVEPAAHARNDPKSQARPVGQKCVGTRDYRGTPYH